MGGNLRSMAGTGFARPELLATAEWLSEQLARDAVRVIDVRWRPDGSAVQAFEAGHIPGAVHLDWRTGLTTTPPEDEGPAIHLAPGPAVAAACGRAGIGDGTSVVRMTESSALIGFLRPIPSARPEPSPVTTCCANGSSSFSATKLKFTASEKPAASSASRARAIACASAGSAGVSTPPPGSVSGIAS